MQKGLREFVTVNKVEVDNMLNRMCNESLMSSAPVSPNPNRWERNEKDDMKTAIEYLFDFKDKLSKLHPTAIDMIENMLQRHRY